LPWSASLELEGRKRKFLKVEDSNLEVGEGSHTHCLWRFA
jgi:hypothetical protein